MWKHNAFGDIVKEDKDFVGHVAYSLYKDKKVKWIKDYHNKNGDYPDPKDIHDFFTSFHSSKESIDKFREDAERMLNEYIDFSFSEELAAYKEAVKDEAIVKAVHKPFKVSVWENLASGLIASFITAFFSLGLWLYTEMKTEQRRADLIDRSPVAEEVKQILKDSTKG
ncbi:TPA: hypothetical protein ACGUVV_004308 [Vibrio vulnificus]|nr:hypothetical protein [Vibrio vulnificus]HDY8021009.1 hypothetical protein [Vibrio vulnificus]HDY8043418.1 hypothetical protein [Vibrio vulnificus]